MEAHKLFDECLDHKIKYSAKAYITGKDKIRSKMATHFPNLDLAFLDKHSEDNEPAPEPEVAVDLPTLAE